MSRNRLADDPSPYLRSAGHQPVDWFPWGEEAFARARAENKPLLLDIGAVWCHWCHVMDHESYENAETARLINDLFIPVKVDRDERPDVDVRYQKAVQAITGQGGWPLTAFLTPEGEVFYGGTYFPPRDAHGRPGFPRVLESVAAFYRDDPARAREQARHIREHLAAREPPLAEGELGESLVQEAVQHALAELDAVNGGFGRAPKFPHTAATDLLLRRHVRSGSGALRTAVRATLEGMARGGVHDQVGGGFHRYGVDARWIIPHFEKMLYDNAGLLANYAHAYAAWGREADRAVAEGTVRFLAEVLAQPGGGLGGSQDADVDAHDDGDFFTWTLAEAQAALEEDELKVVRLAFDLEAEGMAPGAMRHDPARRVLWRAVELEAIAAGLSRPPEEIRATLDRALGKMRAARAQRRTPFVDPTVYASWNGMAAAALLVHAGATGDAAAERLALGAVDRLLREAWDPARGFAHALDARGPRGWGLLDDQAQMGWALLEAHAATGDARYLDAARALARLLRERFFDGKTLRDRSPELAGGTDGAEPLGAAERPITDSPTPSPIATAARFLLRLHLSTEEKEPLELAETILRGFAGVASRYGLFAATYALAVDERLHPPPLVTLVGTPEETAALRASARAAYAPGLAIVRKDRQGAVKPGSAVVCFGDRCLAPIAQADGLRETLRKGNPF